MAETSAYVLCEFEVLATPWLLRMLEYHVRWQSGTLLKEQGSHDLDIRLWGITGLSKGLGAKGPKGLETIYSSLLHR